MSFGSHKSAAGQNTEVCGHGVLRHVELAGDFASRQAIRLVPYQQPKHVETCSLCERTKCGDCRFLFHISGLTDIQAMSILFFALCSHSQLRFNVRPLQRIVSKASNMPSQI